MIRSMTGYGKGQAAVDGVTLTVEIRSVNHRYADLSVKCPRALLAMEGEVRKKVAERLRRGKIDIFINQEFSGGEGLVPVLNSGLAKAYSELFRTMKSELGLTGDVPLSLIAAQKDVIQLRENEPAAEAVRTALQQALAEAVAAVEKMRQAEGEATRLDMEGRLATVEMLVDGAGRRAPLVPGEWQEKLRERIDRLAGDNACDPQRLAQEVALFADRCRDRLHAG